MNEFPPSPDKHPDPGLPSQSGEVPPEIPVSNPPNRTIPPSAGDPDPAEEEDAPVDTDVDGFSD
jgi:hypothetical protein